MIDELQELGLETQTFAKGKVIAGIYETVESAFLIRSGHVALEAIDRHDKPIKNFQIVLGPGQIVFDELLALEGDGDAASEFCVVALEDTEVVALKPCDLVEDPGTAYSRRISVLISALAEASIRSKRALVTRHGEDLGVTSAMDTLSARVQELEIQNADLRHQIGQLDGINRNLTREAVNDVVLGELRKLSTTVRELTSERRGLERRVIERANEAKSAIDYAASLTEELQRLEHLRDLLELEASEPRVFMSEVQRAFLAILTTENRQLQRLGLEGLGVLSSLSRDRKSSPSNGESDPKE
jgi:outer membrane murein-binding lipoprotein Lpp